MVRLLQWLFLGYFPKWKIIREVDCAEEDGRKWRRYYLQCEQTGKIKIMPY